MRLAALGDRALEVATSRTNIGIMSVVAGSTGWREGAKNVALKPTWLGEISIDFHDFQGFPSQNESKLKMSVLMVTFGRV